MDEAKKDPSRLPGSSVLPYYNNDNERHRRDTLLMPRTPSGLITRDPVSICAFDYRLPPRRCKRSLPGGDGQVSIDGFRGSLRLPVLMFRYDVLEGSIWCRITRALLMTNARTEQTKQAVVSVYLQLSRE